MGFDFDDGLGEQGARQLQTKQMLAATAVGVFRGLTELGKGEKKTFKSVEPEIKQSK